MLTDWEHRRPDAVPWVAVGKEEWSDAPEHWEEWLEVVSAAPNPATGATAAEDAFRMPRGAALSNTYRSIMICSVETVGVATFFISL